MALGTEVFLGPGDIMLDGDHAPTERDTATFTLLWHGRQSEKLPSFCLH